MAAKPKKPDPKLGLCLAGGGGLGLLHIGLLEAMEELDLRPGIIAGCSSGAVLGALWASGKSAAEIRGILKAFKWVRVVAPAIPRRGFLSTRRMQSFFREHLGDIDIADLPVKLRIAAVELHTGELAGFDKGPLPLCLAAGCTVPGVFEPVTVGDGAYYDAGGIFNLPLELLSGEKLKTIIAGNTIGRFGLMRRPKTVQETVYQAYLIRTMHLTAWRTGPGGWKGRRGEKLVLVDYRTEGANPANLEDGKALIRRTRQLAREVLGKAFRRQIGTRE